MPPFPRNSFSPALALAHALVNVVVVVVVVVPTPRTLAATSDPSDTSPPDSPSATASPDMLHPPKLHCTATKPATWRDAAMPDQNLAFVEIGPEPGDVGGRIIVSERGEPAASVDAAQRSAEDHFREMWGQSVDFTRVGDVPVSGGPSGKLVVYTWRGSRGARVERHYLGVYRFGATDVQIEGEDSLRDAARSPKGAGKKGAKNMAKSDTVMAAIVASLRCAP